MTSTERDVRRVAAYVIVSAACLYCAIALFAWTIFLWMKDGVWRDVTIAKGIRIGSTASTGVSGVISRLGEVPVYVWFVVAATLLIASFDSEGRRQ